MSTTETVLYRQYDSNGVLLYVGISGRYMYRQTQHEHKAWARDIARTEPQWFDSREQALAAETTAIRTEHPIHNIAKRMRPKAEPINKKRADALLTQYREDHDDYHSWVDEMQCFEIAWGRENGCEEVAHQANHPRAKEMSRASLAHCRQWVIKTEADRQAIRNFYEDRKAKRDAEDARRSREYSALLKGKREEAAARKGARIALASASLQPA